MGWGTGLWGTSAWGYGVPAPLSMDSAYATSTRSVRVLFSRSLDLASAQNPANWTVTRALDSTTLLVAASIVVNLGDEVELFLIDKLPAFPETLTVDAPELRDVGGILIGATHSATFTGALYQTPQQNSQMVDLRNPTQGSGTSAPGALHVGSGGDYDEDSGTVLLRKLIFRRLMTARGEFFHLPNYGIGLRVKEPLSTTDLVKLRTEIQAQVLAEPELDSATVSISMATNGVLTVSVRAILAKTHALVTANFEVPTALVAL